jgi:release factor glutamine methyltransferase
MTTISDALNYATTNGIVKLDARILLKYSTNFSDLDVIINSDSNLTESEFLVFKNYISRRKNNEPVAYIIGEKEFYSLNFKVNEHTLIPRPDTELLVDKVLEYITEKNLTNPKILDLGTGSGAIIISILANIENATGVAVDLNPKALEKAKENATLNNVNNRINFIESNWFSNITDTDFDIIVANPPYITTKMMANLDNDIKNFEPVLALEGGALGYEPYIQIVQNSNTFLKNDGKLFLEIGYDQKETVLDLFNDNVWYDKKCFKDLANNDRLITVNLLKNK